MKNHIIAALLTGIISFPFGSAQAKRNNAKDTIHIVGHAHMDMNWLWTYSETMKMCNDNLRQAVAFMKEFPDYTMIQSQASVYRFVEMVDPPLFELVKKYVGEGRLELAGGMWTEGDTNLSSGEAITRSFLLGQRYFLRHFGQMARVGWLPDNFGHASQLPQILKQAGCDYYYFFRVKPYAGTFWWVGADGSKVLCYANDDYNYWKVAPELKDELQKIAPDKHRILRMIGAGDHGGGPSRADINMVHQLDKTPGYPAVKFTTAGNFFDRASGEMEGRPTHHGEMNFIFEGCYTSVAEIKEGNRNCENSLYRSEFFNTLRWLQGDDYPAEELRDLWTTVTFNQFHDILPGTANHEPNKEAIARYTEVQRISKELGDNAFRRIADEITFKTGMGQPVVACNLQPVSRKTVVEAEVYSHESPVSVKPATCWNTYGARYITPVDKGQGNAPTVLVRDGSGKSYPAQIIYAKETPPGVTSKVQFVVDDFPAGGYQTFYVDTDRTGEYNEPLPFDDDTFETDYFKIKIDMTTGSITSLWDKRSRTEFVKEGGKLNTLHIIQEETKENRSNAWNITPVNENEYDIPNVRSVKILENGPVRACIEAEKGWGRSKFIERTYIYRSYPRIDYELEVHWLETGVNPNNAPMLQALFPLAIQDARFYRQAPFDIIERPDVKEGQEVPAQKWVDVNNGQTGLALLNRTKYGHSFHRGDLKMTLMRSVGNPDNYPNLGKFTISYALYPHAGDWKSQVWQEGENFNQPVIAAEPPSLALVKNNATRPEKASFISIEPANVSLSGMKQSEEGNELILRLVEFEGKETTATIELPFAAQTARRLTILELPSQDEPPPVLTGKRVTVRLKPKEIVTVGIR